MPDEGGFGNPAPGWWNAFQQANTQQLVAAAQANPLAPGAQGFINGLGGSITYTPPEANQKSEKGVPMRRPEVGQQVIALSKIRNAKSFPKDRGEIDREVDRISEGEVPLLEVFWDSHGWEEGFVTFYGNAGIILALRELGFQYLTCEVKIDPRTGLMGDRKIPYVEAAELHPDGEV